MSEPATDEQRLATMMGRITGGKTVALTCIELSDLLNKEALSDEDELTILLSYEIHVGRVGDQVELLRERKAEITRLRGLLDRAGLYLSGKDGHGGFDSLLAAIEATTEGEGGEE